MKTFGEIPAETRDYSMGVYLWVSHQKAALTICANHTDSIVYRTVWFDGSKLESTSGPPHQLDRENEKYFPITLVGYKVMANYKDKFTALHEHKGNLAGLAKFATWSVDGWSISVECYFA